MALSASRVLSRSAELDSTGTSSRPLAVSIGGMSGISCRIGPSPASKPRRPACVTEWAHVACCDSSSGVASVISLHSYQYYWIVGAGVYLTTSEHFIAVDAIQHEGERRHIRRMNTVLVSGGIVWDAEGPWRSSLYVVRPISRISVYASEAVARMTQPASTKRRLTIGLRTYHRTTIALASRVEFGPSWTTSAVLGATTR